MKVFVAGATGAIGHPLIAALINQTACFAKDFSNPGVRTSEP
jgi:hypothetical protein